MTSCLREPHEISPDAAGYFKKSIDPVSDEAFQECSINVGGILSLVKGRTFLIGDDLHVRFLLPVSDASVFRPPDAQSFRHTQFSPLRKENHVWMDEKWH